MTTNVEKKGQWIELIALLLALIGLLVAVGGASLVLVSQAGLSGTSVWPLPALVLIDWALLGVLGFFGAYFSIKPSRSKWSKVPWFVVGALLPLMVLGALTIGLFVLISLLFFLASTILVTIRKGMKWLEYLGLLMLGAVCNLVLLFIFIILGNAY